jgi:hypothetical protein
VVGLGIYTGVLWWSKFTHQNRGVRFLSGRCALLLTLALAISAGPNFQRLHLLWVGPLLYIFAMTVSGMVIDKQLETASQRAEAESEKTGEPVEAILEREAQKWGYAVNDVNSDSEK